MGELGAYLEAKSWLAFVGNNNWVTSDQYWDSQQHIYPELFQFGCRQYTYLNNGISKWWS